MPVKTNPKGTLMMSSQGVNKLFGGCIPSRHLGLRWTSCLKDMLLQDTKYGIVHWQACPKETLASASPGPFFGGDDYGREGEEVEGGGGDASDTESNADLIADSDDELDWVPCWPVRDLFKMLKNHFCNLNFVPKNSY